MLRSTHPQFIPGTNQLIICSNDIEMGGGSMLYTVNGFAKGIKVFSFNKTYLNERRLNLSLNLSDFN